MLLVHPTSSPKLQDKYLKVFSGIGKLTTNLNCILMSKIQVAQKPRRVPFALREKVTAKIDELVEKDIVERVEGST